MELRLYALGIALISIRCQQEKPLNSSGQYVNCFSKKSYDPLTNSVSLDALDSQSDVAWVEGAGRRLFPARYVVPGCFKYMSNEFPLYSCLQLAQSKNQKQDTAFIIPICNLTGMLSDNEKDAFSKLYPGFTPAVSYPEKLEFLSQLLCEGCISKSDFSSFTSSNDPADHLVLDTFNDDRMYLHGTIISKELWEKTAFGWKYRNQSPAEPTESVADESGAETPPSNPAKDWTSLKHWYGILYGDYNWEEPTCTDKEMLISLVEQATDARWSNCDGTFGTFHGMTYHSMLMLTSNPVDFLLANNDWHYLQMFLIAVLQRCAIQRFYREASGLLCTPEAQSEKRRSAVQDKYTLFLNQFWFYEVTEQEQGKVIFDKLQKAMNIKRDVEFLDKALEEINQQNADKLSSHVNNLLLPLSIIGGLWGFLEMSDKLYDMFALPTPSKTFVFSVALIMSVYLLVCVLVYLFNHSSYLKKTWLQKTVAWFVRLKNRFCGFIKRKMHKLKKEGK